MLFLISPAKTLDEVTPTPAGIARLATLPAYRERSAQLIDVLRRKTTDDIAALMDLSTALSTLNVDRYRAWSPEFTPANSKPAVLAFAGDVYGGLGAASLTRGDLVWAQRHLVILSGLYGLLRPLDLLQPYRLEMGVALETAAGRDLYAFWGDELAGELDRRLDADADGAPCLVNLASQEYFRAVRRDGLRAPVVDCVFEDWKDGRYRTIGFYAKRARGLMARHAIQRRVRSVAGLKTFHAEGYAYERKASSADRLVFRREAPPTAKSSR